MSEENMNKIKVIVGITLSILTTIAIVFGTYTHIFKNNHIKDYKISLGSGEKYSETVDVKEKFNSLEMDVDVAEINIEYGDEFKLSYDLPKELKPEINVNNNKLVIKSKSNAKVTPNLNFTGYKIDLILPYDTKLDEIGISLALGDLNINDISVTSMNIDVSCGNININDLTAQKIKVLEDLGDIAVGDVTCNELEIIQSAGDVDVSDSKMDNITVESSMGDINISGTINKVKAEGSLGDINVNSSVDENKMELDLDVDLGDITVNGKKYNK